MNLKGKVMRIGEKRRGQNERESYTFNDKGNLTEKYSDGDLDITYKQDDKGNIKEYINYYKRGTRISEKRIYKYDSKSRIIEEQEYDRGETLSRKIVYKYDALGNVAEENYLYLDGSSEGKYIFKYDGKGNAIERYLQLPNGKIGEKTNNKFDSKGALIEKNYYGSNENLELKYTYLYDDQMNIGEQNSYYDSKGSLKHDVTYYIYVYDKSFNWINKIEINSSRSDTLERVITYF